VALATVTRQGRNLGCVFCDRLNSGDLIGANDLAVAFLDVFPLSPGHSLIVPRRHEADFLALTRPEQGAVWDLLPIVRRHVEANEQAATRRTNTSYDRSRRPGGQRRGSTSAHTMADAPEDPEPEPEGSSSLIVLGRTRFDFGRSALGVTDPLITAAASSNRVLALRPGDVPRRRVMSWFQSPAAGGTAWTCGRSTSRLPGSASGG
jgi:diadenosine tetraphosphate (Ap4A) HIT family hydrolase